MTTAEKMRNMSIRAVRWALKAGLTLDTMQPHAIMLCAYATTYIALNRDQLGPGPGMLNGCIEQVIIPATVKAYPLAVGMVVPAAVLSHPDSEDEMWFPAQTKTDGVIMLLASHEDAQFMHAHRTSEGLSDWVLGPAKAPGLHKLRLAIRAWLN